MNLEEVIHAVKILGLPERASIRQIEEKAKQLLHEWHPDKCNENNNECIEKTRQIIEARKILTDFCRNLEISFKEEDLKKNISPYDFLKEQFNDLYNKSEL